MTMSNTSQGLLLNTCTWHQVTAPPRILKTCNIILAMDWLYIDKNVYKKQTTDSTATSFPIYHGTNISNVHA